MTQDTVELDYKQIQHLMLEQKNPINLKGFVLFLFFPFPCYNFLVTIFVLFLMEISLV